MRMEEGRKGGEERLSSLRAQLLRGRSTIGGKSEEKGSSEA